MLSSVLFFVFWLSPLVTHSCTSIIKDVTVRRAGITVWAQLYFQGTRQIIFSCGTDVSEREREGQEKMRCKKIIPEAFSILDLHTHRLIVLWGYWYVRMNDKISKKRDTLQEAIDVAKFLILVPISHLPAIDYDIEKWDAQMISHTTEIYLEGWRRQKLGIGEMSFEKKRYKKMIFLCVFWLMDV